MLKLKLMSERDINSHNNEFLKNKIKFWFSLFSFFLKSKHAFLIGSLPVKELGR